MSIEPEELGQRRNLKTFGQLIRKEIRRMEKAQGRKFTEEEWKRLTQEGWEEYGKVQLKIINDLMRQDTRREKYSE